MFICFAWYRINAFNLQIYTVFSSARFSSILFLNAFSFLLAVFCISSHPLPLFDFQYLVSKDVAFSLITSNFPCPFLLHPEKVSQTHSPCHCISCPQALSRLLLSLMSFKKSAVVSFVSSDGLLNFQLHFDYSLLSFSLHLLVFRVNIFILKKKSSSVSRRKYFQNSHFFAFLDIITIRFSAPSTFSSGAIRLSSLSCPGFFLPSWACSIYRVSVVYLSCSGQGR